jgi:hypothetical protein
VSFQAFDCDPTAPFAQLGLRFAKALSSDDHRGALAMLAPGLRSELGLEGLARRHGEMIFPDDGPVTTLEIITTMTDWPAKQAGDIGWVYVAMAGDGYSEAVTCIVADSTSGPVIREIEWGRP